MENPRRLPLDILPFEKDERAHLATCATCRAAAWEALEFRAQWRWRLLCPEAGKLSAWLRGGADPKLEGHLRACKLCAEQTRRTAWLAHGAGLLSREEVEAKLAVIETVRQPDPEPDGQPDLWKKFVNWLVQHFWLAPEERQAAAIATGWRLLARGRRAARVTPKELQELLAADDSVTLSHEQDGVRWLLAQRQGDRVVVQAGASAAERRTRFRLVFRRGSAVVHAVEAHEGKLRLTAEDFARALTAEADGWEVQDMEG
jgi:hypothetical protein